MSPREWHKLKKNLVGMFICLLIFGTLAAVLVVGLQSSTVQEKCNDTHLANFPSAVQQAEAYCESVNGEFCTAPPPVIPFSSQEQQDCNPVTNCITLDPDSSQDIKYCCVDEQAGSSSDCTTAYMAFMNELMIMCNAYNDCYARSKNVFIGTILGGSFGAFILSMVAISTVINKKGKDLSNERINPITILFQRHDLAEFETWSNEALKSKDQKTLQVLFILSVLTRFNDASKKTLNLSMSETVSQASTFQRFVDTIRHAATINSRDTAEYETISDAPSPRIRLFRDSTIQ